MFYVSCIWDVIFTDLLIAAIFYENGKWFEMLHFKDFLALFEN